MKLVRADLHIHSVLSPCGELEMSPANIIAEAKHKQLNMIAITDHNTTRQAEVIYNLGQKAGISVIFGAEVTTKEEVHVLCYFPDGVQASKFQLFMDENLPDIKNNEHLFGYQVAVNEEEHIFYTEKRLLLTALKKGIDEIEKVVHELGGLFIPAHVDRQAYGLFSQLGMIPKGLNIDALEFSYRMRKEELKQKYAETVSYQLISSSDAHMVDKIGRVVSLLKIKRPTFKELKMALKNEKGREIFGFDYAQK